MTLDITVILVLLLTCCNTQSITVLHLLFIHHLFSNVLKVKLCQSLMVDNDIWRQSCLTSVCCKKLVKQTNTVTKTGCKCCHKKISLQSVCSQSAVSQPVNGVKLATTCSVCLRKHWLTDTTDLSPSHRYSCDWAVSFVELSMSCYCF